MKSDRRQFLKYLGGVGGASFLPFGHAQAQEAEADMSALKEAAEKPVLTLKGLNDPVIIESIDLLKKGGDHFIRVRSKDGAEGIAVDNNRADYLYPILMQRIVPYFIGKDARNLESHLFDVYRYHSNYKLQGLAFWSPLAWVEFAILDMLGRISGQSYAEMLGGKVRSWVPYYVASGHRHNTPEEEADYLQQLVEETGARAIKFRVGGRMGRRDHVPGRTDKLIPLSRKVLGEEIDIHADANSSYEAKRAIEVGRMLEEINAVFFEEPCRFDHLLETKRVADALKLPVAGGEQEFSQYRFRWMIHQRGVDIVQPDLHYYGGMIRSIRVARMAEVREMPTTAHISGGFGFIYMLHFAARTPRIGAYQEYKRDLDKYGDWFDPPLELKDGAMAVPTGPGVGIKDPQELLKDAELVKG